MIGGGWSREPIYSALIGCRLRGGAAGAAAGAGHGLPPPHRQVHQAGQGDADTHLDTRMDKDFVFRIGDGWISRFKIST